MCQNNRYRHINDYYLDFDYEPITIPNRSTCNGQNK